MARSYEWISQYIRLNDALVMLLMFAYEDASELRVKNKIHNFFFLLFFSQHSSLAQFDCFELNLHVNFQELPNKLPLLIWTMFLPDSVNQ